nr:MAG TPA: hypothetical protein [Crassvirales sp.]
MSITISFNISINISNTMIFTLTPNISIIIDSSENFTYFN